MKPISRSRRVDLFRTCPASICTCTLRHSETQVASCAGDRRTGRPAPTAPTQPPHPQCEPGCGVWRRRKFPLPPLPRSGRCHGEAGRPQRCSGADAKRDRGTELKIGLPNEEGGLSARLNMGNALKKDKGRATTPGGRSVRLKKGKSEAGDVDTFDAEQLEQLGMLSSCECARPTPTLTPVRRPRGCSGIGAAAVWVVALCVCEGAAPLARPAAWR